MISCKMLRRPVCFCAGMAACLMLFTGCTIILPFFEPELSDETVALIRQEIPKQDLRLTVSWDPASFVYMEEVKGAEGFGGRGSKTHIPTGSGLSGRIELALQEVFVFDENAKPLVITVEDARSDFEYSYSAGFRMLNLIDKADVFFKASFAFGDLVWSGEYEAHYYDPALFAGQPTLTMEKAWDDIAVQVAKDAAEHLAVLKSRSN